MMEPTTYKMDKSVGRGMTLNEADEEMRDYRSYTWKERLEISYFLTSIAYNFPFDSPPRMDKTLCIAQSQKNG
jgi:hypothetical protein